MKPIALVFLGDMQSGGRTAVAPSGFYVTSAKSILPLSKGQRWLLKCWDNLVSRVLEVSKTHQVSLMLGGDNIDGPLHHGTVQTVGTRSEMRAMAVELLQPLADLSTWIYSVDGTEAHAGTEGDEDNSIAATLKANYRPYWRMKVEDRWLDWKHDGINISPRPHLADNALIRAAQDEYGWSMELGRPVADLVMRHHAHRTRKPVTVDGVTVVVCGCWQLPTHWAEARFGGLQPSIGAVIWYPHTMILERIVYPYATETETLVY